MEDVTRQCREMRAQRDAAVKQAEDLQAELTMAKASASRRSLPDPRRYPTANGAYAGPMDESLMERPHHPDDLPFDVVGGSRKRQFEPEDELE